MKKLIITLLLITFPLLPKFIHAQNFGCYDIENISKRGVTSSDNIYSRIIYTASDFFNWENYKIDSVLPDGYFKSYFSKKINPYQKIKMEGNIDSDLQNGKWILYIENNSCFFTGYFINGQKEGNWEEKCLNPNMDTIIVSLINFKNDLLNGQKKEYYDGKITKITNYENGLKNGEKLSFYFNNNISRNETFKNGQRHGKCLYFNTNGNLDKIIDFKEGKINGEISKYHKNGKLAYKVEIKNNLPYNAISAFDHERNHLNPGTLKNGTGNLNFYYENGQLKTKFEYKNQLINGQIEHYSEKGELFESGFIFSKSKIINNNYDPYLPMDDLNIHSARILSFSNGTDYNIFYENVFKIIQGVAIIIGIKNQNTKACKVKQTDLYGIKNNKYDWLNKHDIEKTKWTTVKPQGPFYLYTKQDEKLMKLYNEFIPVPVIFPVNSVGIVTSRDKFVIDDDKDVLLRRIQMFLDKSLSTEVVEKTFGITSSKSWDIEKAREDLRKRPEWRDNIHPVFYRPFDIKWIVYDDALVERTRKDIMHHMLKENLGLVIGRQGQVVGSSYPWNLSFISNQIIDLNIYYRGGGVLFPLYLYPPDKAKQKRKFGEMLQLFEPEEEWISKKTNIHSELWAILTKTYGSGICPEQLFYYCYSILYSNIYREKYSEFLKIDFPRIPFTKDVKLFTLLAGLGQRLACLHLMKSPELEPSVCRYQGTGSDKIEQIIYDKKTQRVHINNDKYFEKITPDVWNYHIGGYQVCAKYLKDRKDQKMADPRHYCTLVTAMHKTIEIQNEIDDIFGHIEKGGIVQNCILL